MEEDQERMRCWLRSLGAPDTLLQVDLSPLLRAEDRAMWRHLQHHVIPAPAVVSIRKAILHDTLREKNILPGSFGNFKFDSVKDMEQVETYFEKKNNLAELRLQIEKVESELNALEETMLNNVCRSQSLSCEIEERTIKTQLLKRKVCQVKNNADYLTRQLDAVRFKAQQETTASVDAKMVERHVCKYQLEDCDSDSIRYALDSLRGIPPTIVLHGLEKASRSALIMLFKIFKDSFTQVKTLEDELELNMNLPIERHLSSLQALYLKNEVELSNSEKDFNVISTKLNEEKAALATSIIDSMKQNTFVTEEDQDLIQEFVDLMAKRALQISQVKKSRQNISMESMQLKQLRRKKIDLQEHFQKCQKLIKEKAEILEALAVEIVNADVIGTKNEVLNKCTTTAVKFVDKVKQSKEDSLLALRDLVIEEIEFLVKLPLRAVTRSWEDDYLPDALTVEKSGHSFLMYLLQSQPKTVLFSVLEKIVCFK